MITNLEHFKHFKHYVFIAWNLHLVSVPLVPIAISGREPSPQLFSFTVSWSPIQFPPQTPICGEPIITVSLEVVSKIPRHRARSTRPHRWGSPAPSRPSFPEPHTPWPFCRIERSARGDGTVMDSWATAQRRSAHRL